MKERLPQVSIIIVNWNGLQHLEACLESLISQTYADFEVVLVDNGSTDGSVDFVRARFPWVKLVALGGNTGFAGGNNIGLENAAGEYIVTLNNDTRVDPGWLAELVAVADEHPAAGMVGCRTTSFGDPDIVDTLGGRVCPDGMSRGAYRQRRFSALGMKRVEEALYPSACAALYKRVMIRETGFFDEDFFAYCEDTDLGLRGRLAGWKAVLATHAVVYHKYSATGGTFSPFKLYLVERNHYWAAVKNFPLHCLLALPWHTAARYLVQARLVLAGRGSGREFRRSADQGAAVRALLRGVRDALIGLPGAWRKRRRIMAAKKISSTEMASLLKTYRLSLHELFDDFSGKE